MGYIGYKTVVGSLSDKAIDTKSTTIKAVVIDEKNFLGNSPVSHTFSYSYKFTLNSEVFKGDTKDPELKVGDSVLVEYAESNPKYNRLYNK
ncbi:hypothetical protein [Mucilaginibacter conchicola]|uniref:hypothetical protein n=1 Tax=Mucilaginibacter conchicola TaxID=2303333 RepID=UPI0013144401|nr:hypothetical protein [Mucilaginibacter conchicola]